MNWKVVVGALALSVLMAASALVGSIALHTASADTLVAPSAQPAAQAATTPAPATTPGTKTGTPPDGGRRGGPGGAGPGFGGPGFGGPRGGGPGFGGPGFGGPGFEGRGKGAGATSADGANRVISATTGLITSVKADLTYATGKMDTATVADWVSRAEGLLKSAQSAVSASEFGKAGATAQAASTLARAADLLMQQALGADKLPSYSTQRGPGRDHLGMGGSPTAPTLTQAQASRELAGFYNEIVMKAAVLKATGSAGDAGTYLTAAQNRYSTAYTAYQAGTYSEVHNSVAVGRALLEVADSLARAATTPSSPDAPVTVPAPNF